MIPQKIDVSIIMPCLNEIISLPICIKWAKETLETLKQHGLNGEIVISDNGSTDGSQKFAKKEGCRVVNCSEKGYGNALIHGAKNAQGKYILMGDADGSYDFRDGVDMILKLVDGYDLCMGSRLKGKIEKDAMPWKNRYIGNPVLSGILNLFFQSGLSDAHCGLRAFTKETFHKMKLSSTGMEFASEMVVKASLLELKRTEIPITLYKDKRDRPPHLNPWRDGWRHLKFLLMFSPLWLFIIPALMLIIPSIIIMTGLLATPPTKLFYIAGFKFGEHWMVLSSGLIMIGYQLFLFGKTATIYSYKHHIRRKSKIFQFFYDKFKTEQFLILGFVITLIGLTLLGKIVYIWVYKNFGELSRLREMIVATTLIVMGLQTIFSGFLTGIIREN